MLALPPLLVQHRTQSFSYGAVHSGGYFLMNLDCGEPAIVMRQREWYGEGVVGMSVGRHVGVGVGTSVGVRLGLLVGSPVGVLVGL